MYSKPNTGNTIAVLLFGFMVFVFIPFVMPIATFDLWDNRAENFWIECIYHLMNFAVTGGLMFKCIRNDVNALRVGKKKIAKTVLVTVGLMLVNAVICSLITAFVLDYSINVIAIFPMTEFSVLYSGAGLVRVNPIIGILCMTVLVPVAIVCIYYTTAFAPAACKRPWLGYISVTLLLLVITRYDVLWRDYDGTHEIFAMTSFFMRLPAHLLACWSYQKTDGILAPIFSLSLFNLITSVVAVFV